LTSPTAYPATSSASRRRCLEAGQTRALGAEAADDKQLTKTINRYGPVDLLCIDELGYMELDKGGSELLFQVLT